VEFWVANWQTGFLVEDSLKGKSRSARILTCCEDFLAAPYDSMRNPLQLFPREMGIIGPFSLRHENSFAKSLCCKLIPLAVLSLKLTADELLSVMSQLQALFVVRALYTHEPDIGTRIRKCIGGKIQESERPRPDPLQCWMAWSERARSEGVAYEHVIDHYLAEYQGGATSSQSLSDLEMSVIRIISQQSEIMQKKLEYHWQNFNPIQQSALPLQALATDAWLKGTKPKDASHFGVLITSHLWGDLCVCLSGMQSQLNPSHLTTPAGRYLCGFVCLMMPHTPNM
jgi:hypothetical protein